MIQLVVILQFFAQIALSHEGPRISQPEPAEIIDEVLISSIRVWVGKRVVALFHSSDGCMLLGESISSPPLQSIARRADGLDLSRYNRYRRRWLRPGRRWAVHVGLVSSEYAFGPEYDLSKVRKSVVPFALVDFVSRLCRVSDVQDSRSLASVSELPRSVRIWLVELISMASLLRLEDWQARAGEIPYDYVKLEGPLYSLADRCGRSGRECHGWARLVFVVFRGP
jgi:hypothetical protein